MRTVFFCISVCVVTLSACNPFENEQQYAFQAQLRGSIQQSFTGSSQGSCFGTWSGQVLCELRMTNAQNEDVFISVISDSSFPGIGRHPICMDSDCVSMNYNNLNTQNWAVFQKGALTISHQSADLIEGIVEASGVVVYEDIISRDSVYLRVSFSSFIPPSY